MEAKVAAVHDISGYGRCSLTTAIAVISAAGFQCCPVPTAVLSGHTAFPNVTYRDLTDDLPAYLKSFKELGAKFNAIYSGYLSSEKQIEQVLYLIHNCAAENRLVLVDPVMGDNGKPYSMAKDPNFSKEMLRLCAAADVIIPNTTEMAMLLELAHEGLNLSDAGLLHYMEKLAGLGPETVIVTGVHRENKVGCAYLCAGTGEHGLYFRDEIPAYFPGTGDLLASVILAGMLRNGREKVRQSVENAVDFVYDSIKRTVLAKTPKNEGVLFEGLLCRLSHDFEV